MKLRTLTVNEDVWFRLQRYVLSQKEKGINTSAAAVIRELIEKELEKVKQDGDEESVQIGQ